MRNHLIAELERLAKDNENIYLVAGDLGYGVLDGFAQKYSERFINAGVSEQNMTAMAAGLALEGNIVYTYSIGNFPGMRCLEQIRNDVCYHNANVKIISVGAGFSYGQLGMSHHTTEDIAIMRALPNLHVFSPADPLEAIEVARRTIEIDGPCYIRLGKGHEPELHPQILRFDIDKALELAVGDKVAIAVTGSIASEAKKAVSWMKENGVSIGLYNFITIKPLDKVSVADMAKNYEAIITLEEHNVVGGLGGAICEIVAGLRGRCANVIRMGIPDQYVSMVGSQDYLRDCCGLTASYIVKKIKDVLS